MSRQVKIEDVFAKADEEGEITIRMDNGHVYCIKAVKEHQPFDPSTQKGVKMPGVTNEDLADWVHECRSAGYK